MKVGTDGVLLGAWAGACVAQSVLDIGTGTGLIALMLAQRNAEASVDALEPDGAAYAEAQENFYNSPWKGRLHAIHAPLKQYTPDKYYDYIVSNPPFFYSGPPAPQTRRAAARHATELTAAALIRFSLSWLLPTGILGVIYPAEQAVDVVRQATEKGLSLQRICNVYPAPGKPAHRCLMEFSRAGGGIAEEELVLETGGRHQYSPGYKALTKDFYLAF